MPGCQRCRWRWATFGLNSAAASRWAGSLRRYLCYWSKHATATSLCLRRSSSGRKSEGTYVCHHRESQEIAYGTHHGDEDLPPVTLSEDGGEQVHDGGDLSLHFDKLQGTKVTIKFSWERKPLSVCARLPFCLHKQWLEHESRLCSAVMRSETGLLLCSDGLLLPRRNSESLSRSPRSLWRSHNGKTAWLIVPSKSNGIKVCCFSVLNTSNRSPFT